jgi:nucleoside-diphosphate-sugar epimerase
MHVLVSGHKGYIGSVLVPMLRRHGHEVVGLDSDLYGECSFGPPMESIPEYPMDIRDVDASQLIGFDAVIHLAALSNDPLGDLRPEITYEINHLASTRLAILAKEVGIRRFLFSSSCSTYGASGDNFIDESGTLNPVTHYARSKVLVEQDLAKLTDDRFSPTFLRNATVYGVSPRLRFDLVLNNLVAWAYTTGKVYLKSDGTPWRPIVHVEDVARAFVAILEAPLEWVHGKAFNVGLSAENYTIRALAEIVRETVPDCQIQFAEGAGADKRNYRVSCDRIAEQLPTFQPSWNARAGASELYRAYEYFDLQAQDFEGTRYKRIDHIKHLLKTGKLDESLRRQNAPEVATVPEDR